MRNTYFSDEQADCDSNSNQKEDNKSVVTSETTSPLKTVKRPTRIEAKSTFTLNNAQETQPTVKNDD